MAHRHTVTPINTGTLSRTDCLYFSENRCAGVTNGNFAAIALFLWHTGLSHHWHTFLCVPLKNG